MRVWNSGLLLFMLACAHGPQSTGLSGLKPVAEDFHQRIRWGDYRGAAKLMIPARREAFLKARQDKQDEKNLSITDYDIQDARMGADPLHASVVTRLGWVRLPSASEHTDTITSDFVFQDGAWRLERQDRGPFTPELSEPLPAPGS
jgi:hypothetical protein